MRIKLLFVAIFFSFVGRAQYSITGSGSGNIYTQNFDAFRGTAATLPANWAVSGASYNATYPIIISGAASPTVANATGNNCYAGRASSASSDYSILQKQGTSGSTTFTFNAVNNTGGAIDGFVITWNVEQFEAAGRATTLAFDYRIGAGAYSTTGVTGTNTYTSTTGSSTTFTVVQTARSIIITGLSVANASTVDFRFSVANDASGSGSNCHLGIDDFTVYATSTSPTIIASPASLTGFTYNVGSGPSVNQTFTVSGSNLTNNIVINPTTNYDISTSAGSGFGSSITLTPSSGSVANTTIYVRLKSGLPIGNYNSESVSATSTGASTKNVVCSGNVVTTPPVNDLCINATNLTIGAASIAGTLNGATSTSGNTFTYASIKNDVWYSFTPSCSGSHTITVNYALGPDINFDVFSTSCPTTGTASVTSHSTNTTSETTSANFTKGTTYYIRVIDYNINATTYTIGISDVTPVAQAVTSASATAITATTATLNGNLTSVGICPATIEKGFVYSLTSVNGNPLNAGTGVTKTTVASIATGNYSLALTGLTSGVNYTFKAYVFDGTTYTYGASQNFTTLVPPANDLCSSVTNLTIGNPAVSGTFLGSSSTSGNTFTYASTKRDVWYSFTPTCTGSHTITVNFNSGPDIDFDVFSGSCPTTGAGTVTSHGSGVTDEITTATFTLGITYYIRVIDYTTNADAFTIAVAPALPVLNTSAATSVASTAATINGNITTLGTCPSTIQKGFVYSLTSINSDPLQGGTGVTTTSVASVVTGSYLLALSGLTIGVNYTFKAYVFDGTTYTYGAALNFSTLTPMTNDLCGSPNTLVVNAPATTNTMSGSTFTAPFTSNNDVWFTFTPSCTGTHNITIAGFTGDIDTELYSTSCPVSATYIDNSAGTTSTEIITGNLTSGTLYYVRVLAYNVAAQTSTFTAQVTTDGTININNTGSPATGNINANTSNVVLMGFTTTPNCATSYTLNGVTITKTGTSTTSDISNIRIFYDANANGVIDGGETSISGIGVTLSNSMVFTFSGQTGISSTRNYLLVADVALGAVNGNTIKTSISLSTNLNAVILPVGISTGNAIGNLQTIIPPPCSSAILSSVIPSSGPVGTEITITASSGNLTNATVRFGGILASVLSTSASKIIATVPAGATTGNITIADTSPCNAYINFTVISQDKTSCQGGSNDLFFSEVTDSNTGSLSYVEIYNGTGSTINLSAYSVRTANNGSATFTNTLNLNNVDLASGGIYVVGLGVGASGACSAVTTPGADGSYANQFSSLGSVNLEDYKAPPQPKGNDFIGLYKSGTLIDSWGIYGDPSWATAILKPIIGTDGADFKRKNTAILPSSGYNNSDWDIIDYAGTSCASNNYSDIGKYVFIGGAPPTVTVPTTSPSCKSTTLNVVGTEGYVGGNGLVYQWYVNVPPAIGWTAVADNAIYSGSNSSTLAISNVSAVSNYQFYCQVSENTGTCYTASNAVKITGAITWNGTDWRDSNNVVTTPSIGKLAIINGNYDTAINGSFDACSLVVNNGFTAIINSANYINIQYDLTVNGNLIVKNNGSLVQIDDSGVDTGIISMERTPTILRSTDYIYWSSPVTNFPVANISSSSWLIYKWLPTVPRLYASNFGGWAAANSDIMLPGKGYIVRGLGTGLATFTNNASNGSGTINNGVINVGVERSTYDGPDYTYTSGAATLTVNKDNDNYNLLGNPYPSAIDVHSFLSANTNLEGYVKVWSHGTPISNTNGQSFYNYFGYTYSATDYVIYNDSGLSAGPGDYAIASGQGFIVTMKHTSSSTSENVVFNNSMRNKAYTNSAFYRKANTNERNRIWLDILDDTNNSVRTLIGYIQGATLDKDRMFDAKVTVDSNMNIYSLIRDESEIIQARPIPFDKNDCVPLGVSIPLKAGNTTSTLGTYKIAIAFVDGLFQNKNQEIYLEDKLLKVIHDLRKEPYSFSSVAGRFDKRFVLRYTNTKSLGTTHFKDFSNSVVLASNDGQVKIISNTEAIKKVMIYDILGREIFAKNNINAMELSIKDIILNRQALVVKIVLENGQEISKKIIL